MCSVSAIGCPCLQISCLAICVRIFATSYLPTQTQTNIITILSQVIGDATPDASKLMKREGVRSVPSFHYFKNGEKVDVVNGANAEAIEAAIKKHA